MEQANWTQQWTEEERAAYRESRARALLGTWVMLAAIGGLAAGFALGMRFVLGLVFRCAAG